MTNDTACTFGDRRDEVLIAYLYDDIGPRDRTAFERHLSTCVLCRHELGALSEVRDGLSEWAAPDVAEGIGGTAPRSALRSSLPSSLRLVEPSSKATSWPVLGDRPIWMQAAAAMLIVAASLGLANINLSYTHDGLSVTTGWMRPAPATAVPDAAAVRAASAAPAPWRADLTALEQQLRQQIAAKPTLASAPAAPAAPVTATLSDEALLKRVRALVQESERRQQSELALRVAEMARDSQTLRQADLVRIDRTLGLLQSRTGVEVMRTQQQLNNLAQRVSEQR